MMAEMWFIRTADIASGFSLVLWPPKPEISEISRGLSDRGYRLATTVTNETSHFLIRDDCAIGLHNCETQEGSPFIGGNVIPQLSKRKLLGKIAIPTLVLGIAFVFLILAFVLILLIGTVAQSMGFSEISQFMGVLFTLILNAAIIVGIILVPLVAAFYIIPYPSRNTAVTLMSNLKKIVQDRIPDVEIYDFQIRHERKSEKLPLKISEMLEVLTNKTPISTYDQVLEYDMKY
ncbi:MAG: hypothetical protein P1Q69_12815 [Candidatus Thorarchaeota archaeon]|nr:hypothetical protein [Candidatus Thorarchaeota archaeon]